MDMDYSSIYKISPPSSNKNIYTFLTYVPNNDVCYFFTDDLRIINSWINLSWKVFLEVNFLDAHILKDAQNLPRCPSAWADFWPHFFIKDAQNPTHLGRAGMGQ
jgi:hypothetical protein